MMLNDLWILKVHEPHQTLVFLWMGSLEIAGHSRGFVALPLWKSPLVRMGIRLSFITHYCCDWAAVKFALSGLDISTMNRLHH